MRPSKESIINEDLMIAPGVGATMTVGSDSYAYYVSEVLSNGIVGLYSPKTYFENSWADGTMKVDDFDKSNASEFYIKRRYGKWWKCTKDGNPLHKWTGKYARLHFGRAYAYRDPSF